MSLLQSNVSVDDRTLHNSVLSSSLGAVISFVCCITLFRRAFAEQLGHQFMASDSAIQFMTRRCRLLFFASLFTFANAVQNIVQWAMLLRSTVPDLLLVRIVYLLTFVVALPLQTYATCQRSAVIVTQNPEQRTRFLRLTAWTCALAMVVVQAGIVFRIMELQQGGTSTTLQQWLDVTFVPSSVIACTAIFPLVILSSSIWSLSFSICHRSDKPKRGVAKLRHSSESFPSQSVSHVGSIPGGGTPGESQHGVSPTSQMALPSARSRTYSALTNMSSAVLSVAKRTKRTGSSRANSRNGQFMYPLSRTFIALSVALITLWIFALAASILEFLPYIRTNALNSALNATCIAIEASFERLLKCAKHAQNKKKEWAVDKTFGDVIEQDTEGEVKPSAAAESRGDAAPAIALGTDMSGSAVKGLACP